MSKENKAWWEDAPEGLLYSKIIDYGLFRAGAAAISFSALNNNRVNYHPDYVPGAIRPANSEEVLKKIADLGGRVVDVNVSRGNIHYVVVWPDSVLSFVVGNSGTGYVNSTNKELSEKLVALLKAHASVVQQTGIVNVITRGNGGFVPAQLGVGWSPLEASNYNPEVMEDFYNIVENLKAKDPSGRIAIFDGEPGTGKTYMIRGLLGLVTDVQFVIVQADMIPDLAGPDFISVLTDLHADNDNKPIVLIVEDADNCLGSRDGGNVAAVSAMLNLSDGILGSILDIRMVCTTNLKNEELDDAIIRPGRLIRKVHVGALRPEIAAKVYSRLTNGISIRFKEEVSLAYVYNLAKEHGWKPVKTSVPMGFSAPSTPSDLDDE